MKNEKKVGDMVVCVDSDGRDLTKDKKYRIKYVYRNSVLVCDDKGLSLTFEHERFKLVEPTFTPEYFSALNEKDAEKYIGRTMEFADRKEALKNVWERGIFTGRNSRVTDYSFGYGGYYWQFCRTCPETVQKKMVKFVLERWVNVYKQDVACYYSTKEEADKNATKDRIDCIYIYKEYEVEE
jgi:hypothetical protein